MEYLLRTEYNPPMLGAAIALCAVAGLAVILGGTGVVQALGDRLEQLNGSDMRGLRKTALAALLLVGAALFPGVGWFLILPIALLMAAGSAFRSVLP